MTASAAEPTGAALLARGVCRTLEQLGYVSLAEFPLANGRRADILALGKTGDLYRERYWQQAQLEAVKELNAFLQPRGNSLLRPAPAARPRR